MAKRAPETSLVTLRYALNPNPTAALAIEATFAAYDAMMAILEEQTPPGANLVLLHERAYEKIRSATDLPARLVTLGLRDRAHYVANAAIRSLPLDEKLFAIKAPTVLTISTVKGRVSVPYHVLGYRAGWDGPFAANLVASGDAYEIHIAINSHPFQEEEKIMVSESILARTGRLLAGIANQAIDNAEGANKLAIVNQAIREIDSAADEARAALGKSRAEEYRLMSRQREMAFETEALDGKIRLALTEGREDLARTGVARQIDLESQDVVLERAMELVKHEIEEHTKALQAILSARREAGTRLDDLRKSLLRHSPRDLAGAPRTAKSDAVERATAVISRVTDVPANAASGAQELDELDRLHREKAIAARLEQIKAAR
ncbi:MAG: PspA/IM30 family protein [Pseudomonadota bacterium]